MVWMPRSFSGARCNQLKRQDAVHLSDKSNRQLMEGRQRDRGQWDNCRMPFSFMCLVKSMDVLRISCTFTCLLYVACEGRGFYLGSFVPCWILFSNCFFFLIQQFVYSVRPWNNLDLETHIVTNILAIIQPTWTLLLFQKNLSEWYNSFHTLHQMTNIWIVFCWFFSLKLHYKQF